LGKYSDTRNNESMT